MFDSQRYRPFEPLSDEQQERHRRRFKKKLILLISFVVTGS